MHGQGSLAAALLQGDGFHAQRVPQNAGFTAGIVSPARRNVWPRGAEKKSRAIDAEQQWKKLHAFAQGGVMKN